MKKQPLLFVELLFWKTRRECHYINAEYLLSELGHLKKESANWNNTQGDEEIGSSPAKVWTQDIKSKIKPSNFASKLLCMILYFLFLLGNFFEALRWPFLECGTNFQFMLLIDWFIIILDHCKELSAMNLLLFLFLSSVETSLMLLKALHLPLALTVTKMIISTYTTWHQILLEIL